MDETFSVLSFVAELDPRSSRSSLERLDAAAATAGPAADPPERRVAVLPERFWRDDDEQAYRAAVVAFARRHACWIIGGSLHAERPDGTVRNTGLVVAPDGAIAGSYAKRHPFAAEALAGVVPGEGPVAFDLAGLKVVVCICADLFDPSLFGACGEGCAAILVAAASTSRKPDPSYARALWTHVAVARSWERNAYVVISDWAHAPHMPGIHTSGVSGLADPSRLAPPFFDATKAPGFWFRLPLGPLRATERDRVARNFLWR
ncbi:MAG: carbon-nitrogen hydrolase family protein [Deltaproteobacteria bacterium]|nr:carbon-nitrogen hydrolase family protein [Deltaproteobacteria bacterium]